MLAELVLLGHMKTVGKDMDLELIDGSSTGVTRARRGHRVRTRVQEAEAAEALAEQDILLEGPAERVADQLCERGLMERKGEKVFFVSNKTTSPEVDGAHE